MVFWDNVQRLLDEAFHGKIKISSVRNTANGAEAAAGEWIIMLERCSSFDLVTVWRLMMRRQEETGKPVLAVLLDVPEGEKLPAGMIKNAVHNNADIIFMAE